MGHRFRVSSERLEKPGIEPTTRGLEGEQLNHYTTEASFFNTWPTEVVAKHFGKTIMNLIQKAS